MRERLQELSNEAIQIIAEFGAGRVGAAELADGMRHLVQTATADPSAALVRVRKALQFVVEAAYERQFKEPAGTRPLENLAQRLVKEGDLPRRLAAYGNLVRDLGNIGAHSFGEVVTLADVVNALEQLLPFPRLHREQAGPAPPPASPAPSARPPFTALPAPSRSRPGLVVGATGAVVAFASWWRSAKWPTCSVVITIGILVLLAPLLWFLNRLASPRGAEVPGATSPVRVPARIARLPAGEVLRLLYEGKPPSSRAVGGSVTLRLGLRFRPDRRGKWLALLDGDSLSEADDYRVEARSSVEGYLYVFQVDSEGGLTTLFPALPGFRHASGSNPIGADQDVRIPSAATIYLDPKLGLEHMYAVLAAERWPELETALAGAEALPGAGEKVTAPLDLHLRGVGGTLPETADGPARPEERSVERHDEEFVGQGLIVLVVERWFHHVAPGRSGG